MGTANRNIPVEVRKRPLLNFSLHRTQELIPLILCAACFHDDTKTRDELLHMLFNLIKKPDKEQR